VSGRPVLKHKEASSDRTKPFLLLPFYFLLVLVRAPSDAVVDAMSAALAAAIAFAVVKSGVVCGATTRLRGASRKRNVYWPLNAGQRAKFQRFETLG
jgi:hypothetical protein